MIFLSPLCRQPLVRSHLRNTPKLCHGVGLRHLDTYIVNMKNAELQIGIVVIAIDEYPTTIDT